MGGRWLSPISDELAVGTVSLWGRIIEHDTVWRAEHCYPRTVYTFSADLAPLVASLYRIEAHPIATALPSLHRDLLAAMASGAATAQRERQSPWAKSED
jgi:hypothetical protein